MTGRFLNVKKSTWLMMSLIFNLMVFAGLSIFFAVKFKDFNNAFFFFCIATGFHQVFKSMLFKFDSSCYFGILLLLIGVFYLLLKYLLVLWLYPSFIVFAFAIASFITGCFYKEPFQLFLSLSLFFVSIGLLLFLLKIISIWIFVAILVASVLILIIRFFSL